MRANSTFFAFCSWTLLVAGFCGLGATNAMAGQPTFESQLVWATNDTNTPSARFKPVDAATAKQIESLGLKWKQYFSVTNQSFKVRKGHSEKIGVSEKCTIEVKVLEDDKVEVIFLGKKGEECSRQVQVLKPGNMLVHGGKVEKNPSAWLVTLKRIK